MASLRVVASTGQYCGLRASLRGTGGILRGREGHLFSTSALVQRISSPPNLILNFVPQQQTWIVERFGRYLKSLEPGLNILIPIVDQIKYVQSLKENAIDIPSQSAITLDNVTLHLDGVLYYKVIDPYKASYGVEDAEYAVIQLAQTTMRSELGKIKLDSVFQERENLNHMIVEAINHAAEAWGIRCMRYEIRDIMLPTKVKEAMQMQVEAERKKRANILDSEGAKQSAINRAEGLRQSTILASEAVRIEQVNRAKGEAAAILAKAQARAQALDALGSSIGRTHGDKAASLAVAEQYVQAFSQLAKSSNTLILPEKTGDISSMVSQAVGIFGHMTANNPLKPTGGPPENGDTPHQASDVIESAAQDVENALENLSASIEDTLDGSSLRTTVPTPEEEELAKNKEQHFTLASSMTRRIDKDE